MEYTRTTPDTMDMEKDEQAMINFLASGNWYRINRNGDVVPKALLSGAVTVQHCYLPG